MTHNYSAQNIGVAGNVSGQARVHNQQVAAASELDMPLPGTVNVASELAALRELLSKLNVPDRGKLDRAMEDAKEETKKLKPEKQEVADALGRVIKYAKAADDFGQHADKLLPRIAALGAWLGTHGRTLLAMAGIAV